MAIRIKRNPVERMSHFSDQSPRSSPWQPGIGIQGDHVADVGRHAGPGAVDDHEARARYVSKQTVQLVQLSPLAFPAHPLAFAFIPQSLAMKQKEPVSVTGRSMDAIETADSEGGSRQ